MSNRWLRFVIAFLAIVVSIAAGVRIAQLEQQLGSDVSRSRAGEAAAETAIESIGDLKAALHAYVAPSQSQAFWTSRAAMFTDKTRSALLELDGAATAAGAPVTEALAALDKLGKSEQRARNYLTAGQALLAGDLIFTEVRDLLDALRVQTAHARTEIANAAAARQTALRREQWMLALGGLGILALAVLVLVPPARAPEPLAGAVADQTPVAAPAAKPFEDVEYARVISKAPVPPGSQPSTAPVRPSSATLKPATSSSSSKGVKPAIAGAPAAGKATAPPAQQSPAPPPPVPAPAAQASAAQAAAPVPLAEAAAVCVDLARMSDSGEISKLLERAAAVLNASGIVVWMASEDRGELFPAAAAGYDDRLFSRIGSIPRDASNLTAAAFREGTSRTSPSADLRAAALAVPLVTPDGPVGVLSAELKAVSQVDGSRLAVATIFAAQLSMLLGSMTVAPPAEITQTAQGL